MGTVCSKGSDDQMPSKSKGFVPKKQKPPIEN